MSNRELEYLSRRVASGGMSRRDFLGRAAALGVAAPFAGSLLTTAAQAAQPVSGGTLTAGIQAGQSTDSLDPASWTNQVPTIFGRCWGEQLVRLTPDGKPIPNLASEWSSNDDATVWSFKIRKDVQFHNGKTMKPEDVVATMERHSDAKSKSGALGIMQGIKSVKKDGENVVFTLKTANADLPFLLEDYHLVIQPNGGQDDPKAGIGTGPYKVAEHQPGIRNVGKKFENYWNKGEVGHAEEVVILVINDATARMSALQGGKVQIINRVEPKIVHLVERLPGVTIQNTQGKGFYPFNMFCNTKPFDNNDVRMALKLAVNREEMVKTILRGYGAVGNDYPINSAYPLSPEGIPQRTFDPDKAKHHIQKSGHDGPIVLRTSDVAFPGAVDAAQLYQQSCQQAGINLQIQRVPGDGYWSEVWNKEPFSASYWGGRPTQDQMYSVAYISSADWNDTRFFNDKFDKLIVQARGELDESKRKQMYHEAAMIMRDQGGLIAPMFNQFIAATNDKVDGWVKDPNQEFSNLSALIRCWVKS
ncbi:ABC transporter substrate-binding protein [Pararhizobium mangrovi]|uniref:Twin-arginine translocation signal domain-containing protein n=1 Tax=Pararhizobium mangrovi TaxID=2590452 RepID=A0A506U3S9_9HYPH|nr:ABC transporter substrate-binding protein [Pararhizobium mangrovi]TPW27951.1 twin-arginine translocation signal domain-containing protein [Pararhizobium mangrovi]